MHFYCSNHRTIFCRECIQTEHTDEKCFVVDLYEIEKMRKLQSQNIASNKGQLSKRKDGATVSCVVVETFKPHKHEKKAQKIYQPQQIPAQQVFGKEDIFDHGVPSREVANHLHAYDYGNEEMLTDEARTANDDEALMQMKQGQQMYFNDEEEGAGQDEYDDESDEEEGEYNPAKANPMIDKRELLAY